MSKINTMEKVTPGDDAQSADWFNVDRLPSLAFDHSEIIENAIKIL